MLILGLVVIGLGAALIVAAVFTADVSGGQLEIVGTEVGAVTLFVLGVAAGIAILFGFSLTKYGARRSLRQRREHQRLNELSEKLNRVEAERRGNEDDHPTDRL
jgi:uncharacterized membrane protein